MHWWDILKSSLKHEIVALSLWHERFPSTVCYYIIQSSPPAQTHKDSREKSLRLNSFTVKKEASMFSMLFPQQEGGWRGWGLERWSSGQGSRKEEMSIDRHCSLRWACDTAWPPVRPGLLPVRQQPGMGRAGRGSNMEKKAGGAEEDVWETDELVSAFLCQVRRRLLLGLLIFTQNMAAGVV